MREAEFVGHALNRLIEAEPRFDADDQQVERVGQSEADAVLPPLCEPLQHHAREEIPETARAERQHQVRTHDNRRRDQREEEERAAETDAEEDRQCFVAAEARDNQLPLQLAHLAGRLWRDVADALQRVDDFLLVDERVERTLERRARHLAKAPLDRARCRRQRQVRSRDEERREDESEQRKQDRHTTPRS